MKVAELFATFGFKIDPESTRSVSTLLEAAKSALQGIQKNFQGANRPIQSLGDSIKNSGDRMAKLRDGLLIANQGLGVLKAGFAAARGVLEPFTTGISNHGDEIAKTAKKLRVGTDELQRLRFAADRSGVAAESLDTGIKFLRKGLEEAQTSGSGPFKEALDKLGISLSSLQGKNAEEQMGVIADALNGVKDSATATSASMAIFGRGGIEMGSLLVEGSKGIKALGNEAQRLGGVIDKETLQASEAFNDSLTDLKTSFTGMQAAIGSALLPILTEVAGKITNWVAANRELIAVKVREFVEKLIPILQSLVNLLGTGASAIGTLASSLSSIAGPAGVAAAALGAVAAVLFGLPGLIAAATVAALALNEALSESHYQETLAEDEEAFRRQLARRNKEFKAKRQAEDEARVSAVEQNTQAGVGAGIDIAKLGIKKAIETGRAVRAAGAKYEREAGERAEKAARARGSTKQQVQAERLNAERTARQDFESKRATLGAGASKLGAAGYDAAGIERETLKQLAGEKKSAGRINAIEERIKQLKEEAASTALQESLLRKESAALALRAAEAAKKAREIELRADLSKLFESQKFGEEIKGRIESGAIAYGMQALNRALFHGKDAKTAAAEALAASQERRAFLEKTPEALTEKGDLLAQLTGGRLTADRFGTGSSPGFGAQVVRFDVQQDIHFDVDLHLENHASEISSESLIREMKEVATKTIAEKFRAAVRDVLPEVER